MIKIISVNVNSLRGKSLQMSELLFNESPDIVLCQETKIDSYISSSELFPSDFVTFRKDRNSSGGGVCITVSNMLQATHCSDLDVQDLEAVWIQVHTPPRNNPVYICSIYRPPNKGSDYIELLRQPLEILARRHPHKPPFIIIGGDLNYPLVDWTSLSSHDKSADSFLDIINDFHLQQLVNAPTRHGQSTSSILDLVLSTYPTSIADISVDREFSDHCPISFTVLTAPIINDIPARELFLYNKGDYNQLRIDLGHFQQTFLNSVPDTNSVDVNWQTLKQAISSAVKKNIPSRCVYNRRRRPPWLNASVHKLIRRRDRLAKKAKRSGSSIDRDRYRKARNTATRAMETQYTNHLNNIIGNIESDPRGFYRFIKSRRTDAVGITSLKSNNTILHTDVDKAQCLNDYFGSVFTVENQTPVSLGESLHPDMPDILVTNSGVVKLLCLLDTRKSVGPDNISPHVLKEASHEIAPVLTFIFNQSLSSGIVPEDWRTANIFALHKKGPKDLAENYRPISLTSICCKTLEHIVYSGISKFLEDNKILTPRQHGFRTGYSCETQLIQAINDWANTLDHGHRSDVAIFDFSKAFDSVPHHRLLHKLDYYGIRGCTKEWISSFLQNRSQRVVINGAQSDLQPVLSGVPQGTVLGPLLFLLYINDITVDISSEIRLFADDCILYRQVQSPSDCANLQHDIDKLYNWSRTWQMAFNAKKCHVMSITRKRDKPTMQYRLGDNPLSVVDTFTYLGVTISSDLRWRQHVSNTSAKATRTLNFVRRNIYHCRPEVKSLAYTSLIRPHLEYASAAWDPYTTRDSHQLDKVQRRAARFAKRDYRHTTSASKLISELGWQSLADRRKNSRLCLFYKGLHGLAAIPIGDFQRSHRCTRYCGTDTFIVIPSRIDCYKFSFIPRTLIDWNALPDSTRSKPSIDAFKKALQKPPDIVPHC